MLPRRHRLPRRAFTSLRHAKRAETAHFSVLLLPSGAEGGCAAIVSKKVARLSVKRHLLKRRILSVMRPWCLTHLGIVVHARVGSDKLAFSEVKEELTTLLGRLLPQIRAY